MTYEIADLPANARVINTRDLPAYRATHFILRGPKPDTLLCWPVSRKIREEEERRNRPVYEFRAHVILNAPVIEREASLESVMVAVCRAFDVTPLDLRADHRGRALADARQAFCSLAKRYTKKSYPVIGQFIERDHTTVMHAVRVVRRKLDRKDFCRRYEDAETLVRAA